MKTITIHAAKVDNKKSKPVEKSTKKPTVKAIDKAYQGVIDYFNKLDKKGNFALPVTKIYDEALKYAPKSKIGYFPDFVKYVASLFIKGETKSKYWTSIVLNDLEYICFCEDEKSYTKALETFYKGFFNIKRKTKTK